LKTLRRGVLAEDLFAALGVAALEREFVVR
jgi:hypothetical protein